MYWVVLVGDNLPNLTIWQSGVVPINPIKAIPEILLEAGQLHKVALVRCLLRAFKEVIAMLVHTFMVVTTWLPFK